MLLEPVSGWVGWLSAPFAEEAAEFDCAEVLDDWFDIEVDESLL